MPSDEIDKSHTCFGVLPSFDLRSTTSNLRRIYRCSGPGEMPQEFLQLVIAVLFPQEFNEYFNPKAAVPG